MWYALPNRRQAPMAPGDDIRSITHDMMHDIALGAMHGTTVGIMREGLQLGRHVTRFGATALRPDKLRYGML